MAVRDGRETAGGRWFGGAVGVLAFAVLLAGLLAGDASQGPIEVLLRRSRGEALHLPLARAQSGYGLEVRRGGDVGSATLADFDARLVFVNFWGTFCPPCIEELPSLLALARSRDPRDLVIVAVSYDDSWQAIDDFFAKSAAGPVPPNFVVLRDPSATAGRDLKAAFGTEKIPESFLVRNGTIEAKFVNARDWIDPAITGLIEVLLGG